MAEEARGGRPGAGALTTRSTSSAAAPGRPVVLVSVGYYLPSRRAGGPVRSLSAMVERLSDEFAFRVITPDRDVGADAPYEGVPSDTWTAVGPADVRYVSTAARGGDRVRALIGSTPHDVLYLNSLFHPRFTLGPLLGRRRPGAAPVVVAPRGELSPGAVALKGYKKRPFLLASRSLGLYRDVVWHATSDEEAADVRRTFGPAADIHVARNMACAPTGDGAGDRPRKVPGALRLVFLSRIMPKKGLDLALEALAGTRAAVSFDMYGPIEDEAYWRRCRSAVERLPVGVSATYRGIADPDGVHDLLARYDAFILPTLGENHGHAIVEAMASGLPVIVSDRTPWRDLEAGRVGFDLPLEQDAFARAVERLAAMDETEHGTWSRAARARGLAILTDPEAEEATRALFRRAIGRGART